MLRARLAKPRHNPCRPGERLAACDSGWMAATEGKSAPPRSARNPGSRRWRYGTRKFALLVNVLLGVFTLTLPLVAPLGTVVLIS
jgi:hypothetical protein